MKAIWNDKIIAESNETRVIENNHYFPLDSVNMKFLIKNDHTTKCFWKGSASYYDIVVDDKTNESAAWYYPNPKEKAAEIKDHVAFWKGVQVTK